MIREIQQYCGPDLPYIVGAKLTTGSRPGRWPIASASAPSMLPTTGPAGSVVRPRNGSIFPSVLTSLRSGVLELSHILLHRLCKLMFQIRV